jgi:hypothetical protein
MIGPSKAFFASRLIDWSHELIAALAFLSDQGLIFRSDDSFGWPQIGEKRLIDSHGS